MGRKWTPEQRKAASERAKAAMAAKEKESPFIATQGEDGNTNLQYKSEVQPQDPGNIQNIDVADVLKRLSELEENAAYWRSQAQGQPAGPQAGRMGLVGTYDKYKVDPNYYPDPRQRLSQEPRLQRFAFDMNYELEWQVSISSYKTIDGVNTREPKFTIQLNGVMMDEDTGEPTNMRRKICQAIFHEDPEAAIVVARENGVDIDQMEERAFLDEMRYLRIRDWLLEAFYPPKPQQEKKNKKEVVIAGKLVEVWEVNSESTESIPFKDLNSKF